MTTQATIIRPLFASAALAFAGTLAACAGAGAPGASSAGSAALPATARLSPAATTYTFQTIDNQADLTFNQLLGINDGGEIAGYYGSGATKKHPNKGYTVASPYAQSNFTAENFPGSAQTQVTGLNAKGDTCGFWADAKGNNFGFIEWNGVFATYTNPKTGKGTVNQLLGINTAGEAVGFYTGSNNQNYGYEVKQGTKTYVPIGPKGGTNVTAAGINTGGDVTGFYTNGKTVVGFLKKGSQYFTFSYPNATATTPLGINDKDEIVGAYVDSSKNTHGFVLNNPTTTPQWQSVDDPSGIGTTTINGVNNLGAIVGFYVDANNNTDGFKAKP